MENNFQKGKESDEAAPSYVLRPFAMPLDWLDVSFRVPNVPHDSRPWGGDEVLNIGPRLALVRLPGRSRVYDRLDALTDTGTDRVLAVVRSCPHSTAIRPGYSVQVKVENESLYSYQWAETLRRLSDGLGWLYKGIIRLDIAADGHGFLKPFADCARGSISYGGRADFVARHSAGQLKAAELGVRSGNKFGRIYKKAAELRISGKKYIREYWQDSGGTDLENVERCEIQTKGRELRRYVKAEGDAAFLEYLTSPKYRAQVFASLAETFIRFRTGECGDRSRDRADLLDWDFSAIAESEAVEKWPRQKRLQDFGVNAIKSHVRLSFMLHVATGSARYLSTAQEVAEAAGLGTWYRGRCSLWKVQAAKLSGEGVRASNLFDMLQGCDDDAVEQARVEVEQRKAEIAERRAAVKDARAEHRRRQRILRGIGTGGA